MLRQLQPVLSCLHSSCINLDASAPDKNSHLETQIHPEEQFRVSNRLNMRVSGKLCVSLYDYLSFLELRHLKDFKMAAVGTTWN